MNGTDIKVERVRLGLRQYIVAARLGVPQTTLCAIENGRRPVTHEEAISIREKLRELASQTTKVADDDRAA